MNHQASRKQYKMRQLEEPFSLPKATMPTFALVSAPTTKTATTATATSILPTTSNPTALVTVTTTKYCMMCKTKPCPFKAKTAQSHSSSEWSGEDWDRDRLREHKKRRKKWKEKEEKAKQKQEQEKKILDPNYYPLSPIYIPSCEEDAPTLVDNLIPEPYQEKERNIDASRWIKDQGQASRRR